MTNINDIHRDDDIEAVVVLFYEKVLNDPIVGFIFTDVAKINLDKHIPIIRRFWSDVVFGQNQYAGNVMQVHVDLHQKFALRAGHFTRWLYLFNESVDELFEGEYAQLMKDRAEKVAKSISARLTQRKKGEMDLVLLKS